MSTPLEHYALLSDLQTGPLLSRDGSVDWLCLPRFDSPAVFSALLGDADDGHWSLTIADGEVESWHYAGSTFIVETIWRGPSGRARVIDFLPPMDKNHDLVRLVTCLDGEVEVVHDIRVRFDFARMTPWIRRIDDTDDGRERWSSVAGPDGLFITGPGLRARYDARQEGGNRTDPRVGRARKLVGTIPMRVGDTIAWDLLWTASWEDVPEPVDPHEAMARTRRFWAEWASRIDMHEVHPEAVTRSLLVLRALTHGDTGGIVAAPTTSLPEDLGGQRNWDYRFTWLRDAALTIGVLVDHGFVSGARAWRNWLLRAVAGDVDDLRVLYGLGGERRLDEYELPHLTGYEGSRPVRIGNGAAGQYQADVPGAVMIALAQMRDAGEEENEYTWWLQRNLVAFCEANLDRPDHGIWEMRGEPQFFTHGRVMMWAAFDQGIRALEEHEEFAGDSGLDGLEGDVERWRRLRDDLRTEILQKGYDPVRKTFTQTYDNTEVDASLLQLTHTGFIAYDDERMLGTVAAIEADLVTESGFVQRYRTATGLDGVPGDDGPFLICSFWLVEQYARSGRIDEARALMDRLVGCSSELGLLAEEYHPGHRRLIGNYPQAFSHLGLIRAADALQDALSDRVVSARARPPRSAQQ